MRFVVQTAIPVPKKSGILRPDAASESESTSQYGPVSFVATAQAQSSFAFKDGINIRTNRLDEFSQIAERPGQVVGLLAALLK